MQSWIVVAVLVAYFMVLLAVSRLTSRAAGDENDSFFVAGGNASWWVVSIGMIGASVSGVSFLSVPGMVGSSGFLYLQTALGFILGYVVIAKVLLPVYYRLSTPSIYEYLKERFGTCSYRTGAWFFLVSKLLGTAAKVYVIVLVLQAMAFDALGFPLALSAVVIVAMIWLYTFRGGMRTIIWTDMLQTLFMVLALVLIIVSFMRKMELDVSGVSSLLANSEWSRWVELDDWASKWHFVKQFFSGAFIAVVMTGLDQDMIQKNRAIRTLRQSQKNMYWYGSAFVPLNFLFLLLGLLMLQFAAQNDIQLPANADSYLPFFVSGGYFGVVVSVCFVVGVVSATFSSADSSLASLTTSFCVDVMGRGRDVKLRKAAHVGFCVLLVAVVCAFDAVNDKSLIDLIYVLVSYTYGPLLGLFAFGLFTKLRTSDKAVPYVAIASPLLCYAIDAVSRRAFGYAFGYELLMLNGLITFAGLCLLRKK